LDRVDPDSLKPSSSAKILIDSDYIMAATGVLSRKYKEAALKLLKNSLTEE
ncbi:MAG TPA: glutamate mutase L, partial [Bacilli bacterium]|nr:glutamate mutase L [Bacilli bacterium]